MEMEFPICMACVKRAEIIGEDGSGHSIREIADGNVGMLVPLSDYGGQGASVHYKAWVCTNPECDFNLKIRNGDIVRDEPIKSGSED